MRLDLPWTFICVMILPLASAGDCSYASPEHRDEVWNEGSETATGASDVAPEDSTGPVHPKDDVKVPPGSGGGGGGGDPKVGPVDPKCSIHQRLAEVHVTKDTDSNTFEAGYDVPDSLGKDQWRFKVGNGGKQAEWSARFAGDTGETITVNSPWLITKAASAKRFFNAGVIPASAASEWWEADTGGNTPDDFGARARWQGTPILSCPMAETTWTVDVPGLVHNSFNPGARTAWLQFRYVVKVTEDPA